jgi:hypothetical protein
MFVSIASWPRILKSRSLKARLSWCCLFALAPLALARAEPAPADQPGAAEKLLPPEPGRKACYQRIYDAAHLRDHPLQKVTELKFFLRVIGYDRQGNYDFKNPDHIAYNFALALKRRNDARPLSTSGDCLGEQCVVDCDGGGATIEKAPTGGAIYLRLLERGISFGGDCDAKAGLFVRPGADDKAFLLEPVPLDVCLSLEKSQLSD